MNTKVKTDGDNFALIEHGRALIEFEKDGDSPNCPCSWTWCLWCDGEQLDATCDEASLATSVKEAAESLDAIIADLTGMRDYLKAYGAFGKEPSE